MEQVRAVGEPMIPGTGILFIGREDERDLWPFSWEERPNAVFGFATRAEIRDWVLQVRPRRVVAWSHDADDYVDFDVLHDVWPTHRRRPPTDTHYVRGEPDGG
jgi:hypothetical protein